MYYTSMQAYNITCITLHIQCIKQTLTNIHVSVHKGILHQQS